MRVFRHTDRLPADARGAVVAIGNFDGVHLGHRAVIERTRAIATGLGAPAAVLTFEPHPRRLFQPDAPPFRLSSLHTKAERLAALGLDLLFVRHFDRAFASIPAEDFVTDVLIGRLGVRHVVVGEDFAFGHRRRGDVTLLRHMAESGGFGITPAPQIRDGDGRVISSNTIREALRAGDVRLAARLLGRPWAIDGRVVHGDARGRELGFPTANIEMGDYLRPRTGVYAVRVGLGDDGAGGPVDGAASFGLRPQFDGTDLRLEVFLIDFSADLYGRRLTVAFHDYLRGERAFPSVDDLVRQMKADVADARAVLSDSDAIPGSRG